MVGPCMLLEASAFDLWRVRWWGVSLPGASGSRLDEFAEGASVLAWEWTCHLFGPDVCNLLNWIPQRVPNLDPGVEMVRPFWVSKGSQGGSKQTIFEHPMPILTQARRWVFSEWIAPGLAPRHGPNGNLPLAAGLPSLVFLGYLPWQVVFVNTPCLLTVVTCVGWHAKHFEL